jgi:hypothetical protein
MSNPEIERGTFLIIRTDGSELLMRVRPTIERIEKVLGFSALEFVRIGKADDSDLVMAIDDNGYVVEAVVDRNVTRLVSIRANHPVNEKATAFYHAICRPGTTHQIVGDVAIMHDSEFA